VTRTGGALAKNVFWQTAGAVSIGTTAHFEGTLLPQAMIAMKTGASTNGRMLAQTAVTLQQNVVTQPAP
jgi:Ice-binding-like